MFGLVWLSLVFSCPVFSRLALLCVVLSGLMPYLWPFLVLYSLVWSDVVCPFLPSLVLPNKRHLAKKKLGQ